jgi:hypothetical protein
VTKVDGSKVRLFATKAAASDGAKAIGWPVGCVVRVQTRFCIAWGLGTGVVLDKHTGLPWLSREAYGELYHARNSAGAPKCQQCHCPVFVGNVHLCGD